MKKKTRSRLSNDLLTAFLITIFICLVGAAYSSFLFYNHYFQTLGKIDEDPIATITFKYKTAQRKLLDRNIWDRLKQNSDLYNGDTVHTADYSEATITFVDGNRMILNESTMAQIFLKEGEGVSADLMGGEASVDSSGSTGGFVLTYGTSVMNLEAGAVANVQGLDGGALSVVVVEGSATVENERGQRQTVRGGETREIQQAEIKVPQISVTSPSPNQKVIYHTEGSYSARFAWNATNIPDGTDLILEVSEDKKFSRVVSSNVVNGLSETTLKLNPKTYYWRLRLGDASVSSKISITQALPPSLIAPVQDYSYSYRTRTPSVRFIWAEVPMAASYQLIISRNAACTNPLITQRVSTPSSIISTLQEGKYYWQVTPFFSANGEGLAAASEIHSFEVDKKARLVSPALFLPAQDGIVNIERGAKNTSFSWKMDDEAVKYHLAISSRENLANPVIEVDTKDNFVSLKLSGKLNEGTWYWGVTLTDAEGNVSPQSNVNSFSALKGNPEQRTIEPGNGYRISEGNLPDMTFTWRRNLPESFDSILQVAKDEDFKSIVYQQSANGYSANGLSLPVGTYYWRLHSTSQDMTLDTPAKMFNVVGVLAGSTLLDPTDRAVAKETKPYTFKWSPVPEADFYKVELYRVSTGELVYSDNIYDTSTNLAMYYGPGFVDKELYRFTIQAMANAIPGVQSRRVGRVTDSVFTLIKLKPVEIKYPIKDQKLDGVEATINGIQITWDAVDTVREAQVVLYRVEGNDRIVVSKIPEDPVYDEEGNLVSSPASRIADRTVKFANPDVNNGGDYEVVVLAKTTDGIDISNTDPNRVGKFSVLPVVPLGAASGLNANPKVLDAEYLMNLDNPRSIHLSWNSVATATDYIVTVKDQKGKTLLSDQVSKTYWDLEWMKVIAAQSSEREQKSLYSGTFQFTVEAIRKIDTDNDGVNDSVLQYGTPVSGSFSTNVPIPEKTKVKGASNAYSQN